VTNGGKSLFEADSILTDNILKVRYQGSLSGEIEKCDVREVELIIGREVGGLEEEFERRKDEGGRVWGRNQGSDEGEDEDGEIDEG
jgi:hypothetical protein